MATISQKAQRFNKTLKVNSALHLKAEHSFVKRLPESNTHKIVTTIVAAASKGSILFEKWNNATIGFTYASKLKALGIRITPVEYIEKSRPFPWESSHLYHTYFEGNANQDLFKHIKITASYKTIEYMELAIPLYAKPKTSMFKNLYILCPHCLEEINLSYKKLTGYASDFGSSNVSSEIKFNAKGITYDSKLKCSCGSSFKLVEGKLYSIKEYKIQKFPPPKRYVLQEQAEYLFETLDIGGRSKLDAKLDIKYKQWDACSKDEVFEIAVEAGLLAEYMKTSFDKRAIIDKLIRAELEYQEVDDFRVGKFNANKGWTEIYKHLNKTTKYIINRTTGGYINEDYGQDIIQNLFIPGRTQSSFTKVADIIQSLCIAVEEATKPNLNEALKSIDSRTLTPIIHKAEKAYKKTKTDVTYEPDDYRDIFHEHKKYPSIVLNEDISNYKQYKQYRIEGYSPSQAHEKTKHPEYTEYVNKTEETIYTKALQNTTLELDKVQCNFDAFVQHNLEPHQKKLINKYWRVAMKGIEFNTTTTDVQNISYKDLHTYLDNKSHWWLIQTKTAIHKLFFNLLSILTKIEFYKNQSTTNHRNKLLYKWGFLIASRKRSGISKMYYCRLWIRIRKLLETSVLLTKTKGMLANSYQTISKLLDLSMVYIK